MDKPHDDDDDDRLDALPVITLKGEEAIIQTRTRTFYKDTCLLVSSPGQSG